MKLVENWKSAWRWFSVWALTLMGAIPGIVALLPLVWAELPKELKDQIPPTWLVWVLLALAVGGVVGRMVDQSKGQEP